MRVFIYTLSDPRSNLVRYIGQAIDPEARLKQHMNGQWSGNLEKDRWIGQLKSEGKSPVMDVVASCSGDPAADETERLLIREYLQRDFDLLNLCDGGRGRARTRSLHMRSSDWVKVADTQREAARLVRDLLKLCSEKLTAREVDCVMRSCNSLLSVKQKFEQHMFNAGYNEQAIRAILR